MGRMEKQDWVLEASFVELFIILKDLSQFIYEIESLTVQDASFLMVTFSLASSSSSSSDELEHLKSFKDEGWKSREMVKVSGAGYKEKGKSTLKIWEKKRWICSADRRSIWSADSPRATEVFGTGRRAVTSAADGIWGVILAFPAFQSLQKYTQSSLVAWSSQCLIFSILWGFLSNRRWNWLTSLLHPLLQKFKW